MSEAKGKTIAGDRALGLVVAASCERPSGGWFHVAQPDLSPSYRLPTVSRKRKSFPERAKPTRFAAGTLKTGNKLPMATQMLLYETDEVARNGVFGKLRPEVNPGTPLHNWIVDIPLIIPDSLPPIIYSRLQ